MALSFADRSAADVERGLLLAPKFDAAGLLTAVAVDHRTREVLMVAHMNADALRATIERGEAVYWSRSRKELWHKGATSGLVQKVRAIRVDCDQDAVVLDVEPVGGASCHNGYRSCFYRAVDLDAARADPDGPVSLVQTDHEPVVDPAAVYGKGGKKG